MSLATLAVIKEQKDMLCAESIVDDDGCYWVKWDSVNLSLYKIHHHLEESLRRDGQSFVEDVEEKS